MTHMTDLVAVVVVLDSDFGCATRCPNCDFSLPIMVVPRQDHESFFWSPFQFIIHRSSYRSTLYNLDTTSVVN
jgi:hypothetical protein